jgi:hypothetical protein
MTSKIDITLPSQGGNLMSDDVRNNFVTAASEISALQTAGLTGPYLPLSGGVLNGPVTFGASGNTLALTSGVAVTDPVIMALSGSGPLNLGAVGGSSGVVPLTITPGPADYSNGVMIGIDDGGTWNSYLIIDRGFMSNGQIQVMPNDPPSGQTTSITLTGNTGTNAASISTFGPGGLMFEGNIGFQGSAPKPKLSVTGAKNNNPALASLLTALANYGLILDNSTA